MNIFILDKKLDKSAKMLCNQHLNKQILELCQLLSTNGYGPYKSTHKNHPVTKWTANNIRFCFNYLNLLAKECHARFGKCHKSYLDTKDYINKIPSNYVDTCDIFPIKNDLELVQAKYKEWASRVKPMYPKFTNGEVT